MSANLVPTRTYFEVTVFWEQGPASYIYYITDYQQLLTVLDNDFGLAEPLEIVRKED